MHLFKRWNNLVGWGVFAIAAVVYLMTMEPVSSLWDCSEFIATSYKLEVGHPPGAPLFMMLARLATLFAFGNPDYVGMAVNAMNSLASAFCILFLFWTITHLARRLATRNGAELTTPGIVAILGAGAVGALAYTFTDTFWFSAIEGEVYALSSMFTALVVWLMLKWEEQADQPPRLALDRTDRLPHGTLHRRAYPQPAVYPRAGLHLLLPQETRYLRVGHRRNHAPRRSADRLPEQHHHPLHRLVRGPRSTRSSSIPSGCPSTPEWRSSPGADPRSGLGRVESPPKGPRGC